MRNHLLILIVACLSLSSCRSLQTYYQVCEVQSSLSQKANGGFEYIDNVCTVSYDFWCNGGNPGFVFTNNSDEIIYIDLSKSFFIRNGIAYDYFLNRTVSTSASYVESASASKSGTAYGYWNAIGGLVPGTLSASVSSGNSAAKSSTVATEEKRIAAIPPHTSKSFTEYVISESMFYDCGYNITPSKKETPAYNFQLLNSPLTFGNYITYRIGDDITEYSFTNDFYVSSISFYHADAAIEESVVGCPNEIQKINVLKGASPKKFYIRYSRKTRSTFNSNEKGPRRNVKRNDYDDLY